VIQPAPPAETSYVPYEIPLPPPPAETSYVYQPPETSIVYPPAETSFIYQTQVVTLPALTSILTEVLPGTTIYSTFVTPGPVTTVVQTSTLTPYYPAETIPLTLTLTQTTSTATAITVQPAYSTGLADAYGNYGPPVAAQGGQYQQQGDQYAQGYAYKKKAGH
jgi:hypothetical protein